MTVKAMGKNVRTKDFSFCIYCQTIRSTVWLGSMLWVLWMNFLHLSTSPRLFISAKWISCAIVSLSWAWCCWPHYCCTCCCHLYVRAAWSHLLRLKEWGWWPPLLLRFQPSTCPFAPGSYQGTLHCSSEKPCLLMELDDRYCRGELIPPNF